MREVLFLNNDDVSKVLKVGDAISALEKGMIELSHQKLVSRPRVDIYTQRSEDHAFHRWGTMEGASAGLKRLALRVKSDVVSWPVRNGIPLEDKYCVRPGLFCGLILLFDTETGQPLALINDGILQHVRVGAMAALGVKYLSRPDSRCVGMLGSGGMARSHLDAFCAVRSIDRVQVYSPTRAHLEAYAEEIRARHDVDVILCESAADAARGADILATCTNAQCHTIHADMLEPGMHLSKVSSEWGADVDARIDLAPGREVSNQIVNGKALDEMSGFATYLAGDGKALFAARGGEQGRGQGAMRTSGQFGGALVPLSELIARSARGRTSSEQISASSLANRALAGSGGKQGLQFVTVSSLVYDLAFEQGLGRSLPAEWFLQDIRD